MGQGNGSQMFVHLPKDILKARGAEVEQQEVQTFLEFVALLNLPPLPHTGGSVANSRLCWNSKQRQCSLIYVPSWSGLWVTWSWSHFPRQRWPAMHPRCIWETPKFASLHCPHQFPAGPPNPVGNCRPQPLGAATLPHLAPVTCLQGKSVKEVLVQQRTFDQKGSGNICHEKRVRSLYGWISDL